MKEPLIPAFNWQDHVVSPWTGELSMTLWIVLMAFFVITSCGLIGNYLILRRMALVGDAISHSVLAGIAGVVVFTGGLQVTDLFIGALVAGVVTTVLIELIHRYSRVKQDAAIGITFTTLFALGVILINLKAGQVHIDEECVLYGEIVFVPFDKTKLALPDALAQTMGKLPLAEQFIQGSQLVVATDVLRMAIVTVVVVVLIWAFYKELLVSSFDSALAYSLGINANVVHYGLMSLLSIVVVSAFESVGAILVVAMLILPGATAHLLSARLPVIMALTVLHAALSTLLGFHLAKWLDCSIAGALVVAAMGLFVLAWIFGIHDGLLGKWLAQRQVHKELPEEIAQPSS